MKHWPLPLVLAVLVVLAQPGCIQPKVEIPAQTIGIAPIYFEGDWQAIASEPPRPIERLFKLYYKAPYLFAGESQQGIHIIDNSDPANPQPVAFIRIIGNTDMAVLGNVLYANNLSDLVGIDISALPEVRLASRLPGVFPGVEGALVPENYVGFFECPDPALGTIVGWVEQVLIAPECWR
jgi:hypothetical protein